MKSDGGRNCAGGDMKIGILLKRAASHAGNLIEVETSLGVSVVQVGGRGQAVSLAANVSELQKSIVRQVALHCQMIMLGVLAAESRRQHTVKSDGPEQGEVYRRTRMGIQEAVKGIGSDGAILAKKRRVEKNVADAGAAAKRGLGREVFSEHQFFVAVIEDAPAAAKAGASGPAG